MVMVVHWRRVVGAAEIWLFVTLLLAGCAAKPKVPAALPTVIPFPDHLPRNVGVITFAGDRNSNEAVTDAFAIGLARLHFFPVKRIFYVAEEVDEHRMLGIGASGEETQRTWYADLVDSLQRDSSIDTTLQAVFVGSFSGAAVELGVNQEQIQPVGILNVWYISLLDGKIIWRITVQDEKVFAATMSLRESGLVLDRLALQALQDAFRLPGTLSPSE